MRSGGCEWAVFLRFSTGMAVFQLESGRLESYASGERAQSSHQLRDIIIKIF
jgi:hypothetical protein